ncbi:MAG TPA: class I SAM-dependent methyltransferase [Rugosimonospora sp.]|nr:class I SAM-dependent methyltransferase [Rugosimonospora sp.]
MNVQPLPPLAPSARMRWAVVRSIVAGLRPASILEIGCGGGGFGARLAGMAPRYTAVEPDPTSYRLADERITPRGGTVINGDHTRVPAGEGYDLVCAFEVLEHLAEDEAALADWVRLARPGGYVLLSVPAGPQRLGAWDRAVGHFRRYSPEQIAGRLTGAGCVRPQVRCYGWPVGYLLENLRNRIAGRDGAQPGSTVEERTASSGRQLQPSRRLTGAAVTVATAPFTLLQRLAPRHGVALVAVAQRPAGTSAAGAQAEQVLEPGQR